MSGKNPVKITKIFLTHANYYSKFQDCNGQGKSLENDFFQIREKSGNFDMSQGNLGNMGKVRKKSGNFKISL